MVEARASDGKNYGAILIPEGLLSHIAAFRHLIEEMNILFKNCKDQDEVEEIRKHLIADDDYIKKVLSPWNFSLFVTLPDFIRLQIVNEQEISGEINLS